MEDINKIRRIVEFRKLAETVALQVENDPDAGNRRMGRTGRQILRALHQASMGWKVLYMSTEEEHSRNAFNIACDVAGRAWGLGAGIQRLNRCILLPNGGYVDFRHTNSKGVQGKRYDVATDDID